MKMNNEKLVNCGNDFYPHLFDEVCKELESGCTVNVYVDCIGHTRNNTVQEIYKEKLFEKYGERLVFADSGSEFSYSYQYSLNAE